MITVSLNNEKKTIDANTALADALALWEFTGSKVAVAINGEFVPRSQYAERLLSDQDQIDVVKPVGGG